MTLLECPPHRSGDSDASAALNRRVAVRHLCRPGTAGSVTGTRDLVARSARIENLSLSGLALRLRRPLRRGARLLIQVTSPALGLAYDLSAHVRHCTRQPDGKWLLGCAFARELTTDELENLL